MLVDLEDVSRTVGLVLGRRDVKPDQRLIEDLGAESADILNIVVTLEDKYRIRIEDTAATGVVTVRDLHDVVANITHG